MDDPLDTVAVGAAAAVLISLGGMWLYTQQEEQHLAQLYGGKLHDRRW